MSPVFPREIEIERIMNLVRGFGWEKESESLIGTELKLTIRKELITEEEAEKGLAPG